MTRPALIDALCDTRCYPHPVDRLHVVETHISWIVLTGPYAYKIKKPVNLGFLDFSTLEARRFYCEEELRLNRRLAADLYLEVVPIAGTTERPNIGGRGPVLEYAVKMRQFDENGLLDRVQVRGGLLAAHIDSLARQIASFHQACERAPAGAPLGSPENVLRPVRQNFEQIAPLLADPSDRARLERLREWSEAAGSALRTVFRERQRNGFVRECHGDLHLGNAFLENATIRVFDCIEFNPDLRWIDVMSDIAFLVMDLWHRDHLDLARRFLNAYLDHTGDYAGLATLSFYLAYRAMVRAKVALIRSVQPDVSVEEKLLDQTEHHRFVRLAEAFSAPRPLWIAITHGVSGSGKSFFAQQLLERCDAIRIRSDVERKRLHGLGREAASASSARAGLYTEAATRQTYERLASLAATVLDAGWPVIADATFADRVHRDLLRAQARRLGVPWLILAFRAPEATLRERVAKRASQGGDPSEATLTVLERQIRSDRPLAKDEYGHVLEIGIGTGADTELVAGVLRDLAQRNAREGQRKTVV